MMSKAKIAFVEFVRPDCYWPHPYTFEQAFEVLRWMVRTGLPYQRPTRWGDNGPIQVLSCAPSCTGFDHIKAIRSLDDLRHRFHYALLTKAHSSRGVDEWRESENIKVGGERILCFRHHKPFSGGAGWRSEADVKDALEKLFKDGQSLRTKHPLNRYHRSARTCKSVTIQVEPEGFGFTLEYGWPAEKCSSHWFHELAYTEGSETFLETAARAIAALAELTAIEVERAEARACA